MTPQTPAGDSFDETLERLQLYGVYESEYELRKEMEKHNIETAKFDGVESSTLDEEDDFLAQSPYGAATITPSTTMVGMDPTAIVNSGETNNSNFNNTSNNSIATRQQTSGDRDVWGRYALKEAKDPIPCPACTRPITTNRFAMHLDKCMGIGTTVRSAASGVLGTSSTRSTAAGK